VLQALIMEFSRYGPPATSFEDATAAAVGDDRGGCGGGGGIDGLVDARRQPTTWALSLTNATLSAHLQTKGSRAR
jgi:hypothetical protein